MASTYLKRAEYEALIAAQNAKNFPLMAKWIGQAVHRGAAAELNKMGLGNVITYSNRGVDFVVKTSNGTRWVELTTRSQAAGKFGKGVEYAESLVVTYRWPGFFFSDQGGSV